LYYGLGILIIVVGAAYSVFALFSFFGDLGSGQQFVAPGSIDLFLGESGQYTIFYESQTTYKGELFITGESLPLLGIDVENKTNGSKVPIYSTFKTTYTINGRTGESICAFRIDQPGIYLINSSYSDSSSSPKVVLALSKSFDDDGSKMWNNAILYLGSVILGIGVILATFFKRQKEFKRLKEEEDKEKRSEISE
jgi:hypothetical protein